MRPRYFQLRADGKRDAELYTSLNRAAEVLVRDNRSTAHVVKLDTPGGAVVRGVHTAKLRGDRSISIPGSRIV